MKEEVIVGFFAQMIAKETVTQELLIEMYSAGNPEMKSDLQKHAKDRYQEILTVLLPKLYDLAKHNA